MNFFFSPVSSPKEMLQHLQHLPASLLDTLKFPVPTTESSPLDVGYVTALNYFGLQLAAESKDAFVTLVKDGGAGKKALADLRDLREERARMEESFLCMGVKVVEGENDDGGSLPLDLFPGMADALERFEKIGAEIVLLQDFLAAPTLKAKLEAWALYLDFGDYSAVEQFYLDLNRLCALHRFGNYRNLCATTRYFDHLRRTDDSVKDLFTPSEWAAHRTVFGAAAPYWTDALLHVRRHGGDFWLEAFAIGAIPNCILFMERQNDGIVVHAPIGTTFNTGAEMDSGFHFWLQRPATLARIEQIARARLGGGPLDMTAFTGKSGVTV